MNSPDARRQSRMVVYNLYNYLKKLASSKPNATIKELFLQKQNVTADASGVSYRTVQRICAEADMTAAAEVLNNIPVFESPKKKNPRTKPITDLYDFDKSVVRQTVREFYVRVIVDEDIDLLALLTVRTPQNCEIFLLNPGKEKVGQKINRQAFYKAYEKTTFYSFMLFLAVTENRRFSRRKNQQP
ncbi:hypothetical protein AVEN_26744-1 [Araneus ventricosus]|uniref:Uncharacterized protein n=1 Tax=Araneus ventricosus TaxID=182803 RepID=A0A4Y2H9P5_ARAVE|nr:hypothetical protein AVEN_26744-1 [Araneus ventricosus]